MQNIIAIIISVLLITFVIIYGICMIIFEKFHKSNKGHKIKHNGVIISLTSDEYETFLNDEKSKIELEKLQEKEKKQKEDQEFTKQIEELNNKITQKIITSNEPISLKVLKGILDIEVNTRDDFETKKWLFNDGKLRTDKEVSIREKEIYNTLHRENYDAERTFITFLSAFIPFTTTFFGVFLGVKDLRELPILGIPIALCPASFMALIGSAIGHSINISNAEEYGIPANHPSVKDEKVRRGIGITSAAVGTISVGKKTKSAIKEIGNPESWKEMQ